MMKEKSKNAAKTRREKEKIEFQELARLLPLPEAISGQLDKASVIRLATAFLRLRRLLLETEPVGRQRAIVHPSSNLTPQLCPPQQQPSAGIMPSMIHPSSFVSTHQYQGSVKSSLTDTSNTFIQPKLPASTPPPPSSCSNPPSAGFVDNSDGTQSTGKFNGSWQTGQQLAQALDGFVLVVGADGKLIYVSEAASQHLGLSQVEMTGQPIGEYLHQDDHTELASLINFYKTQLMGVHNQQDFRIPISVILRMKCVLAKRNAGIVQGGMKVIHCVGYIRSIPPPPPAQPSASPWSPHSYHPNAFSSNGMSTTSPSPPNMPISLGNGMFIEDRMNDLDERRTSSSTGSGGARVPSPHLPPCASPPLPSFAPFAMFLVGVSVPPASATELRLASSSLFMLRTTLDMKLLFVETPRVTELLGYEAQDLIEKNLYNLIHCEDLKTFQACHRLLLMKGQCVTSYYRVLTRDGGWVWVQSVQTIVSNSRSSRPHCIVSVNHVISQDQQIFSSSSSIFPPASFLPRRTSTSSHSSSLNSLVEAPPLLLGNDAALNQLSQRHHQLVVPSPRSLAQASEPILKPSPVVPSSPFLNSNGFVPKSEDVSSRSVVPTGNNWPVRPGYPNEPFHHTRQHSGYHGYGFPSNPNDYLTGSSEYAFFSKGGMSAFSGVDSYDFSTPLPITPAATPSRFGTTPESNSTPATSNQSNSSQVVGGIHAHTINYTLHIENFNASANANSAVATTPINHGNTGEQTQKQSPPSVASAVASATAGLVLGGAPTTVVMESNNNANNNNSSSSCWFGQNDQISAYFNNTSWQNSSSLKRSYSSSNAPYSPAGNSNSQSQYHPHLHHMTSAGSNLAPQSEPLAKRPTPTTWLNTIQQQP